MPRLKEILSVVTIIASIASGVLWCCAAGAKVRKAKAVDPHFSNSGCSLTETDNSGSYDVIETGKRQNIWNAWAAGFAALAAFSQAAKEWMPE